MRVRVPRLVTARATAIRKAGVMEIIPSMTIMPPNMARRILELKRMMIWRNKVKRAIGKIFQA